jgi:lysophospholipase L1-like esterase
MPAFLDRLRALIDDPAIELLPGATGNGRPAAPPSRLGTEAFKAIEAAHRRVYGVATLPTMLTGATDMAQVRARGVQCYGIGPMTDREDGPKGFGAHSDQERILEEAFQKYVRVHWEIVRDLAAGGRATAVSPATAPAQVPIVSRRPDGLLNATAPVAGTVVRYTLDGSEPAHDAGAWLAPVDVPPGYVLKARAFTPGGSPVEESVTIDMPLPAGMVRTASTLVPVTQNRDWRTYDWVNRHAAAAALMRERRPEIVMLGDSITHFWGGEPDDGRRTGVVAWDRLFAGRRVVNLGYGWDRTENVLWRLTHGEFEGVSPKVVVVMIGTNNVGRNTPDEIAAGIQAICALIHERSPSTRILLLGIFPRGERPNPARESVSEVNRRIAALDGQYGISYHDIGAVLVSADGTIATDVMGDFLHPTAKGYELWAAAMKPMLDRLLAP